MITKRFTVGANDTDTMVDTMIAALPNDTPREKAYIILMDGVVRQGLRDAFAIGQLGNVRTGDGLEVIATALAMVAGNFVVAAIPEDAEGREMGILSLMMNMRNVFAAGLADIARSELVGEDTATDTGDCTCPSCTAARGAADPTGLH